MQEASTLQGISQKERERERERRTQGPKSLVEQGCFIEFCVSIYTILKVASSNKDQKTRLYKLPRKQGAIETIRPERQSISKEGHK